MADVHRRRELALWKAKQRNGMEDVLPEPAERLEPFRMTRSPSNVLLPDRDPAIVDRDSYQKYLESGAWARRREEALGRAFHRCQVCNRSGDLEAHHRTYDRVGNEDPSDLTVLCWECHKLFSSHQRIKTLDEDTAGQNPLDSRTTRLGGPLWSKAPFTVSGSDDDIPF
jgi:HNH endonuclease